MADPGPSSTPKHTDTTKRVAAALAADQSLALYPDLDTPFQSETDKVHRLLPFHIFQQSQRDIDRVLNYDNISTDDKPKDPALTEKPSLRWTVIDDYDNYRTATIPWLDHVVITQAVVEADRVFNASMKEEFKALQKSAPSRSAYPGGPPQAYPVAPSYPFVYPGQQPTIPHPPPAPTLPKGPIPVRLPSRLLTSLKNLGIIPVPAAKSNPATPCVSHGTLGSGEHSAVNLTINLSLLQQAQVQGLAVLLNSLVSRPQSGTQAHPTGPSTLSGTGQ
ncbi:hypothetical protein BKA62DRAFT_818767 [Auriculariales sp. MPI-PUGE-AT-0066]|nr:hypothetical protein BKA62DRAFT_818767 [Auriculariales sp. MPI-PUGE-AT-0066]